MTLHPAYSQAVVNAIITPSTYEVVYTSIYFSGCYLLSAIPTTPIKHIAMAIYSKR
jgi:hypothetical protein